MASLGFPWHLINHFDDAATCHAAMRDGGAVLDWGSEGISDKDAKWIASALADPTVCVIQQQSLQCHSPLAFPGSVAFTLVHVLSSVTRVFAIYIHLETGFWPRRHVGFDEK